MPQFITITPVSGNQGRPAQTPRITVNADFIVRVENIGGTQARLTFASEAPLAVYETFDEVNAKLGAK